MCAVHFYVTPSFLFLYGIMCVCVFVSIGCILMFNVLFPPFLFFVVLCVFFLSISGFFSFNTMFLSFFLYGHVCVFLSIDCIFSLCCCSLNVLIICLFIVCFGFYVFFSISYYSFHEIGCITSPFKLVMMCTPSTRNN